MPRPAGRGETGKERGREEREGEGEGDGYFWCTSRHKVAATGGGGVRGGGGGGWEHSGQSSPLSILI